MHEEQDNDNSKGHLAHGAGKDGDEEDEVDDAGDAARLVEHFFALAARAKEESRGADGDNVSENVEHGKVPQSLLGTVK